MNTTNEVQKFRIHALYARLASPTCLISHLKVQNESRLKIRALPNEKDQAIDSHFHMILIHAAHPSSCQSCGACLQAHILVGRGSRAGRKQTACPVSMIRYNLRAEINGYWLIRCGILTWFGWEGCTLEELDLISKEYILKDLSFFILHVRSRN